MMEKEKNELVNQISSNLGDRMSKGLELFKHDLKEELEKCESSYSLYKKESQECKHRAIIEIERIRLKRNKLLEQQLNEIDEKVNKIKIDTKEQLETFNNDELEQCNELMKLQDGIRKRLTGYLAEECSEYGWEAPAKGEEAVPEEKVVNKKKDGVVENFRKIVNDCISDNEFDSCLKKLKNHQIPKMKHFKDGNWEFWKESWFKKKYPNMIENVMKEAKEEFFRNFSNKPLEEGDVHYSPFTD